MTRVLVLFASRHGQTRTIASRIAETLRTRGLRVHLADAAYERPDPRNFEAVIVGSPVHMSRHHAAIERWLKRHAPRLATRAGAFFSVSMSASSRRASVREGLDQMVAAFLARVHWQPAHIATFGGALRYTQYGWLTRLMMKLIGRSQGRPVDTSQDYEFTDWAQVDRFGAEIFAALIVAKPGAATSRDPSERPEAVP